MDLLLQKLLKYCISNDLPRKLSSDGISKMEPTFRRRLILSGPRILLSLSRKLRLRSCRNLMFLSMPNNSLNIKSDSKNNQILRYRRFKSRRGSRLFLFIILPCLNIRVLCDCSYYFPNSLYSPQLMLQPTSLLSWNQIFAGRADHKLNSF